MKSLFSRRASLAGWLTTWYTVTSFVLIAAVTGLLYWGLKSELNRDGDLFFTDKIHVVGTILRDEPGDWGALREEIQLESAARTYDRFYIRLLNRAGRTVIETPGMDEQLQGVTFPPPSSGPSFRGVSVSTPRGIPFRLLTTRLRIGTANERWTMQIAVERTQQYMLLARYRDWLWCIWGAAIFLCPFLGHRIALRGTRPLQRIGETARLIGSQTLSERIDGSGYPVELAALAEAFNAMLDRLENSFGRLSQFSADLAHELRTPVNNLRGEAEVALSRARSVEDYRDVLGSCLEETGRLAQLISDLLFLARSENPGEHLNRERLKLRSVLGTVVDYFEVNAAEQQVVIAVDCDPSLQASLDRQLMQRAIANLFTNALAHTPAGGTIALRAYNEGQFACIEVQDTGIGIRAEDLPRIFDRFFRVDRARSSASGSTGLGLAIVKGILTLHGGNVSIESTPAAGTVVTLRWPDTAGVSQ